MLLLCLLFFFLSAPGCIEAYESAVGLECGIRYANYSPSIVYGRPTKHNEFPWHVALYRMDNTSNYEYICGGSIIDYNIVLTAAHCVFDDEKQDLDYRRMVVVTGKHYSSWEHRDANEQRLEVISKKVRETYKGALNRLQDDIALLALNESIKFSSLVMPVCIDWSDLYREPVDDEIGTIVGWGYNEFQQLSKELQEAKIQRRNFGECRDSVRKEFSSYLTYDKFCALKLNKSDVQGGDSGGGLTFSRNVKINNTVVSRHFIYGVLSGREVSPGSKSFIFFTSVLIHIPWVNSTKMNILAETEARKVCGLRHKVDYIGPRGLAIPQMDYPWIATIYMMKKNKFFGIRCVGTIIHQRAIITSVWCIEDRRELYQGVEYRILVGKHEMNMRQMEEQQQDFSISKIHKHRNYVDWKTRAENEMVILIVNDEIKFTNTVVPICMDWDRNLPLENPVGLIATWDLDECHCQEVAEYEYLDIVNCSQAFGDKEEYQTYVTSDKVCGKYTNGTRFKYGSDVGSGYVFAKNESSRHYLQGVVSKGRPGKDEFLTFTNVELNLRWISDILVTIYNTGSW